VERMVQPVPGHLGEQSRLSPWLVVVAVGVVALVGALLLLFTQFPGSGFNGGASTTATPRPRTTIIRITATPPPTATVTPIPTVVYVKYTVKQGDTLSTIARQFKVTVEAIRAANNLSGDTIHIGDVLNIPLTQPGPPTPGAVSFATGGQTDSTSLPREPSIAFNTPTLIPFRPTLTPAGPTTPTPTPGVVAYTVKSGDTLLSIAAVFSTTVQSIMDLNKLSGPSIRAGQVITVPVGIWTATPTPTEVFDPTATLTPQFSYAAPDLLYPSEGADFAHTATVTLQWLAPGTLKSDEFFVVHLSYILNGVEQSLPGYAVYEGTYLTLDSSPAGNNGPTQFFWYVVVVRSTGCGATSPAAVQPCAVSPISPGRSFTWR
jgi:LysM repeat protein